MKGTSFQNGIEFKITIKGEQWAQGDTLVGELQVLLRNPGAETKLAKVILAETTERKLKLKSDEAFDVIAEMSSTAPQFPWSFKLPLQARISDKAGCLCLLYGSQEDPHALGILKLNIFPHHYFNDLIELMRTEFRYALKSLTARKGGWVDANLENLTFSLQLTEDTIEANFEFARQRVDAMKAGLQTKVEKEELQRSWPIKEFVHDFNDRINKDVATESIRGVIEEYKSGSGWLA